MQSTSHSVFVGLVVRVHYVRTRPLGFQQLEGIDFFETYALVVQWTTIGLMFILEIPLGLKSMQGDVTCAFLHADLEENETVYVDMPMGFAQYGKNGKKQCLNSKRHSMGCGKVLERSRSTLRSNWSSVASSNQNSIHVCSLDPK